MPPVKSDLVARLFLLALLAITLWLLFLRIPGQGVVRLFSVPVPASDPVVLSRSLPLPPVGTLVFQTQLVVPSLGVVCSDRTRVATGGRPADPATLTEALRDLADD